LKNKGSSRWEIERSKIVEEGGERGEGGRRESERERERGRVRD
jgi:hypothetical protein